MFFDHDSNNPQRMPFVRDMLMYADEYYDALKAVEQARDEASRRRYARQKRGSEEAQRYKKALEQLEEFQTQDFAGILRAMDGKPVVIRLLDPPLHEFLPPYEELLADVAVLRATNGDAKELEEKERLLNAARSMREQNPMMGHRGCRLGITYPDIYEMQVRAIVRAACDLTKEGLDPRPEVMIPLTMDVAELKALEPRLKKVIDGFGECGGKHKIHFGTMIELPRAALVAGQIAPAVDFFSFGSNDLTQMTFGFSRDDAEEKFLRYYVEHGILPDSPVPHDRRARRRPPDPHRRRRRPRRQRQDRARRLRRARRRSGKYRLLPPRRTKLRLMLAHAHPDGEAGGGAGGARGRFQRHREN